MIGIAATVLGGLFNAVKGGSGEIAKASGVSNSVVSKVINAIENHTQKDERLQKFMAEQIDRARSHDTSLMQHNSRFVNDLKHIRKYGYNVGFRSVESNSLFNHIYEMLEKWDDFLK